MMKVRTTITVDLAIIKANESLVEIFLGDENMKKIIETQLLNKVRKEFVFKGLDLEHNIKMEMIEE